MTKRGLSPRRAAAHARRMSPCGGKVSPPCGGSACLGYTMVHGLTPEAMGISPPAGAKNRNRSGNLLLLADLTGPRRQSMDVMQEMKTLHRPTLETAPKKEDLDLIDQGMDEDSILKTGQGAGNKEIVLFIRGPGDEIIGGVIGTYNTSGWLWVSGLWVAKEYRSKGYGTMLMQAIEAEAQRNGCSKSHLCTFEYQAPEFYKKLGYVVFATLERFHKDYDKVFFRKDL